MKPNSLLGSHVVLLLLLALIPFTGCRPTPPAAAKGAGPVPVNVGTAVKKDVPLDLRAIGNVESIATVEITAQVSGELIEVGFQEGQDVKKGDLLFSIQPKLYATQLAQAEANLARDRAAAANAQREATRAVELSAKGAVSREQLEQTRSAAEGAAATVHGDEAMLVIAQVQLSFATIKSPIDGRTGTLNVQRGNIIKDHSTPPMTTIKQLAPIYVTFAVPEMHLATIRKNMANRALTVTAYDPQNGETLATGALSFVANAVDMTTGTITLKASFANEDRALWPGAFVDVFLRLDTEAGVTVVPSSAVTVGQKGPQVFVVKSDGTVDQRTVKTGRSVAQETIIQSGVQPGEIVVTNGQLRLVPGSQVSIIAPTSAALEAGRSPGSPPASAQN
ncbi:MAG: efflux transporter, family, subunit, partial [Verrucomicrobia bacterium]|nr:efflux transporter, family, subunit [Verrucomicrobiota bacterium]